MAMKIRLQWFNKQTEALEAAEYSVDFEEHDSILNELGLHEEPQIYAGGFDVLPSWIAILQPHFRRVIEPNLSDFQISFHYQGAWPPPPKQPKKAS
ncbi:colicin E3-like toxin immunity protein [Pseudomonas marginalis]|uniref:Cloacin n=1 Tax=Pseudomonas marginalis TaxID=298 RepID=A0A9X5L0H1_PSEMA|nr:colicin E3-like toxin immunity protein [Pseudomonas marginalis]OAJ51196.1 cloacin [Pseudomonas marginalis]